MFEEALNELSSYLQEKLGASLNSVALAYGDLSVEVDAAKLLDVLTFLPPIRDRPRR